MNEIFYEFKELKSNNDLSSNVKIEIILHFLSKIEEAFCLFETKLNFIKTSDSETAEQVIKRLQEIFKKVNTSIVLVQGKIREIFLSFSY